MDYEDEKRNRFELFIKQAELPQSVMEAYFHDGYIKRVQINYDRRSWQVTLAQKKLIPSDIYDTFCENIHKKMKPMAEVTIVLDYDDHVQLEQIIQQYWALLGKHIIQHVPSCRAWFDDARYHCEKGQLTVCFNDSTSVLLARKKKVDELIVNYYAQRFNVRMNVNLKIDENSERALELYYAKKDEEQKQQVEQSIAVYQQDFKSEPKHTSHSVYMGSVFQDRAKPIAEIVEQEKKIVVQGTVFGIEKKLLRNGNTLLTFYVTDFTDSLQVKMFGKTKEEINQLDALCNEDWIKIRGRTEYDRFTHIPELVILPSDIMKISPVSLRTDDAMQKRVEFHIHTTMSAMDAVTPLSKYIKTAADWGHSAIGVSDHGSIQCFPEAAKYAKKYGVKILYGMEANVVNDAIPIVINSRPLKLQTATYVVFDIETTGLSVTQNKIIEIAAVRIREGKELDRFTTFVNPHEPIPYAIQKLTNICDDMVKDAPDLQQVISQFVQFIGTDVLVAHNATFDIGFIQAALKQLGMPALDHAVLDTLELARLLHPNIKNHRLNTLADKYKASLDSHHRAIDDTLALCHILNGLLKDAAEQKEIHCLDECNRYIGQKVFNVRPFHCGIYALNSIGKQNLYKLVSLSHTEHFKRVPCIPKSKISEMREGLLLLSGCEKGEFFESALHKSIEETEQIAQFYDVLEVQPLPFYTHLVNKGLVSSVEQIKNTIQKIIDIGHKLNKPVIATGNVHYLHPEHKLYREITIHGITGFSPLKDMDKPDAHLRTTEEMLAQFDFLHPDVAYEIVVVNTNKLADRFETISLFPDKLYSPVLPGAEEEIRNTCYVTARSIYGDDLPAVVVQRLEKELGPIVQYGFSANYLIAQRLVKKSNEDGYIVGSRGSVGSSVVATFLGISEVNPLPPHYICDNSVCKHSEWFLDGEVRSGFDLENKPCPNCQAPLRGEGQNIPFETFLGFKGDKVPDIDLNFSGEYQPHAHNYTKVLFGEKNVFRAGTIGTVAQKTAFGFVKKYEQSQHKNWRAAELNRLAAGCTGVKRSSGQHPGGIVVVPDYIDVEQITPVQYPADDTSSEWKTTHFDYHAFDANLLKLDILGHDDPTMMRMLQDLTAVDPVKIPMNDKKVMSLFHSTDALEVTSEQIRTPVATYGIPEMGTKFVRQMLFEAQPTTFSDLLQISGLSHGTGVWLGNAQELIKDGTCNIKTVIGCRDDIMLFLIDKANMNADIAFNITENVRKGKGLPPEWIEQMQKSNVPLWYIQACLKIQYMFPKAHAAAYVVSAVRMAFFKLYYPIEYYATYFTVRAEDIDIELCCQGYDAIYRKIVEIEQMGFQAPQKEKNMLSALEIALEMTARGFTFQPIDLYRSHATDFLIHNYALLPPFSMLQGIGDTAARNIMNARQQGPFLSIEDFQLKSKATKTVIQLLTQMGCFRELPETNQLVLF